MGSTRLPGKVLLELNRRPVLEYVVRRCQAAARVDRVVVATSELPEDDAIEDWCAAAAVDCVRGSSDDVLARFVAAAKAFPCSNVVRITADCPLIDPGIIDAALALHQATGADYTSNEVPPTYPIGFDVEVVKTNILNEVAKIATLQSHREHVTLYIRENLDKFKVVNLEAGINEKNYRLTIDRPEDYLALKALLAMFPPDEMLFSFYQILDKMRRHPELTQINSGIDRFEGVKKSAKSENRKLSWE